MVDALGDSRTARWAVLPLPRASHLRRRRMNMFQMFWESLVRDSQNPRNMFCSSDFSGRLKPAFHTRKRDRVCARACARAHKHGRLHFRPNVTNLRTRSEELLIRSSSSLPCRFAPHDTFLILPAVVTRPSPLRGDGLAPRLVRIVSQQKLEQSYQIVQA